MQSLNTTVEILGGVKFAPPFIKLAVQLVENPEIVKLFSEDTGLELNTLLLDKNPELVKRWLDWVAIRYWGVQTQAMTKDNIHEVYEFISNTDYKGAKVKPISKKTIKKCIDESVYITKNHKIVGVLLVCSGHVEAMVSTVKGLGMNLIGALPKGSYTVDIHSGNDKALKVLSKLPFEFLRSVDYKGVEFGLYVVSIEGDSD